MILFHKRNLVQLLPSIIRNNNNNNNNNKCWIIFVSFRRKVFNQFSK